MEAAKECKHCGAMFTPKYEWSALCWPCFLETNQGKAWKARQEEQANGFGGGQWRQEQERNYSQGGRYGFHDSEGFHYEEGQQKRAHDGKFRSATPDEVLDKDLLRKLIMLCHPDKHGGSTMSNEVTKVLLTMKEKMK